MAMLAGPRRKQKWSLNPRGKDWSEDSTKFGQKMLEKMGWSAGKGLGAKEQGVTEHVRVRMKNDQVGIGFEKDRNDQWVDCQDGFNSLLQNLQKAQFTSTKETTNEASGTSLEEMSKRSSVRVHYQKFTRGKDVNRYSKKDLANIFGKKSLDQEYKKKSDPDDFKSEVVGSKDTRGGVLTIQGGSMVDYFNSKANLSINQLKGTSGTFNKLDSSDSESEQRVGFGFSAKKDDFTFDNPCLNVSDGAVEVKTETENCDFVFDNPCLDLSNDKETCESPKGKTKKKKKSNFYVREDDLNSSSGNLEQKLDQVSINSEESDRPKKPKKIKKCKNYENGLDNLALDIDVSDESSRPSRKRKRNYIYTGEEPVVVQPVVEAITPKKVKKVKNGISNDALDLSFPDQETDQSSNFEVPRTPKYEVQRIPSKGIENTALSLSDGEEDKKSEKKKKKKKEKNNLDKYEVVTDKLKRKHDEDLECQGIVNEALQDDDANTEQLQNEANERKSRKRRRKERRVSTLETIIEVSEDEAERSREKVEETPEIEIVGEVVDITNEPSDVSKKKKKKKKADKENSESANNDEELTMEEFLSELNQKASPKSSSQKKPKHVLQALFKKNPTPVFNGSNIHEIKVSFRQIFGESSGDSSGTENYLHLSDTDSISTSQVLNLFNNSSTDVGTEFELDSDDSGSTIVAQENLKTDEKDEDTSADVDESEKCPICKKAWKTNGTHRVCSLQCGHLFGFSCLSGYLDDTNKVLVICPECKGKTYLCQVRFIFQNKISSVDVAELKKLKEDLSQTQKLAESALELIGKERSKRKEVQRKVKALDQICFADFFE